MTDEGAGAVAGFDHAERLERFDRFAEGGPADAERFRELGFGRKGVAGMKPFIDDEAFDPFLDHAIGRVAMECGVIGHRNDLDAAAGRGPVVAGRSQEFRYLTSGPSIAIG
jgi:hypothetical protein